MLAMSIDSPSRFYQTVSVTKCPEGYLVCLDGKPLKAPSGSDLIVPGASLAAAIAQEWDSLESTSQTPPLTGLLHMAIELIEPRRADVVEELVSYACTDLICYQAEVPEELVARQYEAWTPLHDWAADTLGAPLNVTSGIVAIEQPQSSVRALERQVASHDVFALAALQSSAKITGSIVIALALSLGRLTGEEAWAASRVEEMWQRDNWGDDPEDADRVMSLRAELANAARFMSLLESQDE